MTQPLLETVSSQIYSRLPDFVKTDYPKFIAFMRAYYEFLEQHRKPYEVLTRLLDYNDIDKTSDEFAQHIKLLFMENFPKEIIADETTVLKNIREFYRAKGSEKSFEFIFRVLYDKDITLYYPKEDLLIASGSIWAEKKLIKLVPADLYAENYLDSAYDKKITGQTSGATAYIASVIKKDYQYNAKSVYELELKNITGEFVSESVTMTHNDDTYTYALVSSVVGLSIDNFGRSYKRQEIITDITSNNPFATGVRLIIGDIGNGPVDGVEIDDPGYGYKRGERINFLDPDTRGIYGYMTIDEIDPEGRVVSIKINSGGAAYEKLPRYAVESNTFGSGLVLTLSGRKIGKIKKIKIDDPGIGYANGDIVTFSTTVDTASAEVIASPIFTVFEYIGNSGHLSSEKVLQDNYYWQLYSYEILVEKQLADYINVIKNVIHPAGMQLFGNFIVQNMVEKSVDQPVQFSEATYVKLFEALVEAGYIDVLAVIYQFVIVLTTPDDLGDGQNLGPTYGFIDRHKFKFKPNEYFSQVYPFPNERHWKKVQTLLRHFIHPTTGIMTEFDRHTKIKRGITVEDVTDNSGHQTSVVPDIDYELERKGRIVLKKEKVFTSAKGYVQTARDEVIAMNYALTSDYNRAQLFEIQSSEHYEYSGPFADYYGLDAVKQKYFYLYHKFVLYCNVRRNYSDEAALIDPDHRSVKAQSHAWEYIVDTTTIPGTTLRLIKLITPIDLSLVDMENLEFEMKHVFDVGVHHTPDSLIDTINADESGNIVPDISDTYIYKTDPGNENAYRGTNFGLENDLKLFKESNVEQNVINPDAGDDHYFGTSTAISDRWCAIGAKGIVYMYYYNDDDEWELKQALTGSQAGASELFGYSVALYYKNYNAVWKEKGYLVVGAPQQDSNQGAVYVFEYQKLTDTWTEIQMLTADDGMAEHQFGYSVSIWDNYIAISSPYEDVSYTSSSSSIMEDTYNSGAVYIFKKSYTFDVASSTTMSVNLNRFVTSFIQSDKLKPINPKNGDEFGYSVSLNDRTLAVGAYNRSISDDGLYPETWNRQGSVFIFDRISNQPTITFTDNHPSSSTQYPITAKAFVQVDSDGNIKEDYVRLTNGGQDYDYAPLVEFSPSDNGVTAEGTATVSNGRVIGINLTVEGTGYKPVYWEQSQEIENPEYDESFPYLTHEDRFGFSVVLENDQLVVGCYRTKVFIYNYNYQDDQWELFQTLRDTTVGVNFGSAVSIADEYMLISCTKLSEGGLLSYLYHKQNSEWVRISDNNETDIFSSSPVLLGGWGSVATIYKHRNRYYGVIGVPSYHDGSNAVGAAKFFAPGINEETQILMRFSTKPLLYGLNRDLLIQEPESPVDVAALVEASPYSMDRVAIYNNRAASVHNYSQPIPYDADITIEYSNQTPLSVLAIYKLVNEEWEVQETKYLDHFVNSMSMYGNFLILGGDNKVAVYRYVNTSDSWILSQTITRSSSVNFGFKVVFKNNLLVVSDPDVNGQVGEVYSYRLFGTTFNPEQVITYPKEFPGDFTSKTRFGFSMDHDENYLIIGAPYEETITSSSSVYSDETYLNSGRAYIYKRNRFRWDYDSEIVPDPESASQKFGYSVAINNGMALVGYPSYYNPTSSSS